MKNKKKIIIGRMIEEKGIVCAVGDSGWA